MAKGNLLALESHCCAPIRVRVHVLLLLPLLGLNRSIYIRLHTPISEPPGVRSPQHTEAYSNPRDSAVHRVAISTFSDHQQERHCDNNEQLTIEELD